MSMDSSLRAAFQLVAEAIKQRQPLLQDGVTIKTINGQSVLGAGNITVAGAGDVIRTPTTLGLYGITSANASTLITLTLTQDVMSMTPYLCGFSFSLEELYVYVTTPKTGKTAKLVIYDSDPQTGIPSTKIYQGNAFTVGSVGLQGESGIAGVNLYSGKLYWIGIYSNHEPVIRATPASGCSPIGMVNPAGTAIATYIKRAQSSATDPPSTWTLPDISDYQSGTAPCFYMKWSVFIPSQT